MSTQLPFLCNGDDSFAVISACYTLTEQYRNILIDLGKEHQLSENEMLVLVHLAQYPEACTQKKLQGTHLQLSVSSNRGLATVYPQSLAFRSICVLSHLRLLQNYWI